MNLAWQGSARHGSSWQAWQGTAGLGRARLVLAGTAGHGRSGHGLARLGAAGRAWRGSAWSGSTGLGTAGAARPGLAWHGLARPGMAVGARQGPARHGWAAAWHGRADPYLHTKAPRGREPHGAGTHEEMTQVSTTTIAPKQNGKAPASRLPKGPPPPPPPSHAQIQIDRIDVEVLRVPVLGTTPLIVHRFSEKAKRQMLDNMQGRKSPKQNKDPEAEYEAAFYRFDDDTYGFPVVAFKAATVEASRFYGKDVTKVGLRQFLFMRGIVGQDGQSLAAIAGEPKMREDVVRVGRGGTDLRYRPEFTSWSTTLEVVYVVSALTRSSVLSLIDAGGMGVGVGEWRPEKNGDFGTYRVDPNREVEVTG